MSTVATSIPREGRALLDAIAQGESDPVAAREGISSYFILVGGGSFEHMPNRDGYNGFPDWDGRQFSAGVSHAAGRYQFEPATWRGIVPRFGSSVPDFRNPADQDWGAWFLAQSDYHARVGHDLLLNLKAGIITGLANVMRPTWASLSETTLPERYKAALDAIAAEQPPVPPSSLSAPPQPPAPTSHDPTVDDLFVQDFVLSVMRVQRFLKDKGVYSGPINGDFGSDSRIALAAYIRNR